MAPRVCSTSSSPVGIDRSSARRPRPVAAPDGVSDFGTRAEFVPWFECRWDAPGRGQVDHAGSSPYDGMNELKSARLLRLAQRYTVLSDGPARPSRSLS